MLAVIVGSLGCAGTPPAAVAPAEPGVEPAATTTLQVEPDLEVQGFLEALSGGYILGVRVRNVGATDRIVLTGVSAFREAVFVDGEGEETARLSIADDDVPLDEASCEPIDGVLLRSGEELRLIRAFEEAYPQVAARGEFELHVTRAGGVRPVVVRRVRFEAPLAPSSALMASATTPPPVDASAAGLTVQAPEVLVTTEPTYFAGVRLANRGAAPVVVPMFGLLHAAADFGEGELFPIVGRGTGYGCPHCGASAGPSACDFLEGVLLSPGEALTLVADLEADGPQPSLPARVAYLLDAYPLSCAGGALHMSGQFVAETQPLR